MILRNYILRAILAASWVAKVFSLPFCSPREPSFCVEMLTSGQGFASVRVNLTKTNLGWVAFGIMTSEAVMPGTDVHLAYPTNDSSIFMSDRKAVEHIMPLSDDSQDVFPIASLSSYNATSGNFSVVFRRRFFTGDRLDNDLIAAPQNYALVYNLGTPPRPVTNAVINYHSFHEVFRNITLIDTAGSLAPKTFVDSANKLACAGADTTFCVNIRDAGQGYADITLSLVKLNLTWAAFGINPKGVMPQSDM
ncbi:hypothetical protein M427DRAFT_222026 [Gonapodya prolifera JEL478]|uniref:DOMON domain-containing protein n=1 Tax=Gonapodya prolifera (strain JEL478) TaxID=1344416 RepID=A0A139AMX1_GONPJ|nr:hypothetical protein M427DRAFT_222026 [Gonapodya prolifera JEL478]|eukprot:KXS18099.1 hypothetical protein M427DRAFT_222026 [Gonapodya prolifera JEL478]